MRVFFFVRAEDICSVILVWLSCCQTNLNCIHCYYFISSFNNLQSGIQPHHITQGVSPNQSSVNQIYQRFLSLHHIFPFCNLFKHKNIFFSWLTVPLICTFHCLFSVTRKSVIQFHCPECVHSSIFLSCLHCSRKDLRRLIFLNVVVSPGLYSWDSSKIFFFMGHFLFCFQFRIFPEFLRLIPVLLVRLPFF